MKLNSFTSIIFFPYLLVAASYCNSKDAIFKNSCVFTDPHYLSTVHSTGL
jgi:hypothetical protein